mmetsp:Transcript_151680/g.486685  ORF Transcript_151680/g.486685 Transcript_151680/m.486685 type:complete len:100 (+) Transcript_151680:137-436(+)
MFHVTSSLSLSSKTLSAFTVGVKLEVMMASNDQGQNPMWCPRYHLCVEVKNNYVTRNYLEALDGLRTALVLFLKFAMTLSKDTQFKKVGLVAGNAVVLI